MTNKNIAAVFDVDGTLIANDSMERMFFRYLWRYGEIGAPAITRLMAGVACGWWRGHFALADNKAWLAGHDATRLRCLARDCFAQEISRRLLPAAVKRLRWHQDAGHEVVLLSGTLDVLLVPLADHLNVAVKAGASLEIVHDKVTGRLANARPYGPQKVTSLRQLAAQTRATAFDFSHSFAYADHYADRFLLSSVGHPVAANPDRRLQRLAESQGWMIEEFVRELV